MLDQAAALSHTDCLGHEPLGGRRPIPDCGLAIVSFATLAPLQTTTACSLPAQGNGNRIKPTDLRRPLRKCPGAVECEVAIIAIRLSAARHDA